MSKNLFLLFYLFSRSRETSIEILTWAFLPGTIIHELSHLFLAELLRVKTGSLTFKPEIRENGEVRAGGLKIAKTDPLRHFLIGLAPTLTGLSLIFALAHFYLFSRFKIFFDLTTPQLGLLFLACYFVFQLSNTMFSSKKDLETALFPLLIVSLLVTAFYFSGLKVTLSPGLTKNISQGLINIDLSLGMTILIDLLFLGGIKLLLALKKPRIS